MRPDEHKAKESRKYQQKKKQAGDSSAAEAAEARKKAAKARDKGVGIAAIRRRNGESTETEEDREERKAIQAKFAKRKITTNADRYQEETEQEILEREQEMGIDRETTDLVNMLENADEGNSVLFKFKDEQLFDSSDSMTATQDNRNMLQLDFKMFENALQSYDADLLLGLDHTDKKLVDNALHEHPVVLDKPIVPAFSKNAKGYVLFKAQQQPVKPNIISEADGIYVRNDGSNHRVIPKPQTAPTPPPTTDDLDELLALDTQPKKTALPKPGSIKKPVAEQVNADDEAWLDDILG